MSNTLDHVAFERLADLADGRLDSEAARQVRLHVAGCAECAASLDWLAQTIELMRSDSGEDAPPALVARATRLFRPTPPIIAGLRRLVADLRFDSATAQPALGLRAGTHSERQLLFSTGEHDLDLRLTPEGGKWLISGQLLGSDTGGEVALLGGQGETVAPLDELCEFVLPAVAPGVYSLMLRLPGSEIAIPQLQVGR